MTKQPYTSTEIFRALQKEYDQSIIDHIIKFYEKAKSEKEHLAAFYRRKRTSASEAAKTEAILCLKSILHKKLFNAQCLWRAYQLELPLLNTMSVPKYAQNIFEATFLDPITQEEIEVFLDYYLSEEAEPFDEFNAQELDQMTGDSLLMSDSPIGRFKDFLQDGADYPKWYSWYDRYFGTGGLQHLRDDRLLTEQSWIEASRESNRAQKSATTTSHFTPAPREGKKQDLYSLPKELLDFAEHIQDIRMVTYLKRQISWHETYPIEDGKNWIKYLEDLQYETVPIETASNWREAVKNAGFRHLKSKAAKLLPKIYEQYLNDPDFTESQFNEEYWEMSVWFESQLETSLDKGRRWLENEGLDGK